MYLHNRALGLIHFGFLVSYIYVLLKLGMLGRFPELRVKFTKYAPRIESKTN